jgi:hypothetical protein
MILPAASAAEVADRDIPMDKKEDVSEFEKLEQQLHSFLAEISELSKKKPNDPLNKFKLKFINAVLGKMNNLLGDFRPFDDFEQFDVDELPTNSDVVVILGQYAAATYLFRTEHTTSKGIYWFWLVRGKISDIKTENPQHFKYQPK